MVHGQRVREAIADELYLRPDVIEEQQLTTSAAGVPRIVTTGVANYCRHIRISYNEERALQFVSDFEK